MLKSVSSFLVASQFVMAAASTQFCYGATPEMPEMQLLKGVIALQGQQLSNDELQAKLSAEVSRYQAVASTDGQGERMEQALVNLNIFTPDQAQDYWKEVQNQTTALSNHEVTVPQALVNLATRASNGAQFSTCAAGAIGILGGGGLIYIIGEGGAFVGPSNAVGFGIEMGSLGALGIGILLVALPTGCR